MVCSNVTDTVEDPRVVVTGGHVARMICRIQGVIACCGDCGYCQGLGVTCGSGEGRKVDETMSTRGDVGRRNNVRSVPRDILKLVPFIDGGQTSHIPRKRPPPPSKDHLKVAKLSQKHG